MQIHPQLISRIGWPLLCLLPVPAAGALEFEPGLAINAVYVDNINLTTQEQIDNGMEAETDVLTQIVPGVSLSYDGLRATAELNYRYYYLVSLYDDDADTQGEEIDRDRGYHRLRFDSETELVLDRVFFRANADFNQSVINPNATVDTIFDSSGNLTDRGIYTLNPYWSQSFAGGVTGTLGYSRDAIRYQDERIVDSDIDTVNAGFDTRGTQNRLSWRGNFVHEEVSYLTGEPESDDPDQEEEDLLAPPTITSRESDLTAAYLLGSSVTLTATIGEEFVEVTYEDRECTIEERDQFCKVKDPYWLGGLAWAPSSRTTIELGGGERFYGNTAYFRFNNDRPNRVWTMSYEEDVTTNARDQLGDVQLVRERDTNRPPDLAPSDQPGRPGDVIFQLPTLAVFLEKTVTLGFAQRFTRGQLSFDLEWEEREYLVQDEAEGEQGEARLGDARDEIISGEIELDWQLGSRTTWSVFYQVDEIITRPVDEDGEATFPGEGEPGDRFYEYGTNFRWQIRPQLDFNAFIRNRGRDSEAPPDNGERALDNDYEQWLIGVGLDMRF